MTTKLCTEILSDSDEAIEEVVVKDAGLDNDADNENSSSDDDGYESTEDEAYKPPPSGYNFSYSSESEEMTDGERKGKAKATSSKRKRSQPSTEIADETLSERQLTAKEKADQATPSFDPPKNSDKDDFYKAEKAIHRVEFDWDAVFCTIVVHPDVLWAYGLSKPTPRVKTTKVRENVSRDDKAKTQGKRAGDKKERCVFGGESGPDVRKKSDARPSVVGSGRDEPRSNDNDGPNKDNKSASKKPATFDEEIAVKPRDDSDMILSMSQSSS
ncbi:uncharacterized protein LOC130979102 [Arachis stenosperma]|uniref:uncharacterized protein LOC130979102 n=1 Tax=Arachis stenosperma TaxID=217475 RepID=UPI0025AB6272|nr:uncharacterized protein LOC130979102 [Arachis stenosperma]